MNKFKTYLINKYADHKLKQLSKTWFIARNTYTTRWEETGDKTYGRVKMFEAVNYAMIKVYGPNWNLYLRVNGLYFTEDKNGLYLHVMTCRPGQVIGNMGTKIDNLQEILSNVFLKDVEIRIEETTELYGMESHEDY